MPRLSPPRFSPLSLHDALPILDVAEFVRRHDHVYVVEQNRDGQDRKSTRLNSSHRCISYAVFCLKKKSTNEHDRRNDTRRKRPQTNEDTTSVHADSETA